MSLKNFFIGRAIVLLILIIMMGLVGAFFALNAYIRNQELRPSEMAFEPYRGTLMGVYGCLQPKDTEGPRTLECALGMKTDAGEYYAVDFSLMSQQRPSLVTGDRFTATGMITPIERLSGNQWQKYTMSGIFSITDSFQKEGLATSSDFIWKSQILPEKNGIPMEKVAVTYNGVAYSVGEYSGCNLEPQTSVNGSISRITCWYGGAGNEIGVFNDAGTYIVRKRWIQETGNEENVEAYGTWEVVTTLK